MIVSPSFVVLMHKSPKCSQVASRTIAIAIQIYCDIEGSGGGKKAVKYLAVRSGH